MISKAPTQTNAGKDLLARAIAGEIITFTRFKIGNGEISSLNIEEMTDLQNPLLEFPVSYIDKSDTGYVKLTGKFDNTQITTDFRWRELGIYCKGSDGIEVLYAYANDGENAGMLQANLTDVIVEQEVSLVIAVGDAENVTAILSESALYVSREEFARHIEDSSNPHNVDKDTVGLGKVPNVATNDQTPTYTIAKENAELTSGETLGSAFGKIAKAVKSFISHLADKSNPHNVTAKDLNAANKEHTHATSDITSGILGILRGGTGATTAEEALKNLDGAKKDLSNLTDGAVDNLALPIKSLAGQKVETSEGTFVTAADGATIIGDLGEREYRSHNTYGNIASGKHAVAMGQGTTASGFCSTAMGFNTTAKGENSIAAGWGSQAIGTNSIALGKGSTAEGDNSIAFGAFTTTTGAYTVAMGAYANASKYSSIALGEFAAAQDDYTFAKGFHVNAREYCANAIGAYLDSYKLQTKFGYYANDGTAGELGGTTGDALIIGNGTSSTRSNAFRVAYDGSVYGMSAYNSTGADYAELFEWVDGNKDNEDRRGRFVTLDGDKIRLATAEDDYILGVISAAPCLVGDSFSDDWQGKYLTDVFGEKLTQTVHIEAEYEEIEIIDPETGEKTIEKILTHDEYDAVQWILNPDYDPEQEYVPRENRPEWAYVGTMGKLVVVDDGSCEPNGYCCAGKNGIATKATSANGYRVMERLDGNHIRIWVR